MIKALASKQIEALETEYLRQSGLSKSDLMTRVSERLFSYFSQNCPHSASFCVLCGGSRIGAIGLMLAVRLLEAGYRVNVIMSQHYVNDALYTAEPLRKFLDGGGTLLRRVAEIQYALDCTEFIVDAIGGSGYYGERLKECDFAKLINFINTLCSVKRIAIDVPFGVNPDNGSAAAVCFNADTTLTLTAHKIGLLSYPARGFVGDIRLIECGTEAVYAQCEGSGCIIADDDYLKQHIPDYGVNSNKGSHGKLLAVVGSREMTGAAVMSVGMALRSGVGLLAVAGDEVTLDIVKHYAPEPIHVPFDIERQSDIERLLSYADSCTAMLIGCGLGISPAKRTGVTQLLLMAKCRIILDADGINLIAGHIDVLKKTALPPILTPHPGEFSRLNGRTIRYNESRRLDAAREFAERNHCILVLKGASTVIADDEGHFAVNPSGTSGLAKGGSGDVLAGLIAGLAAQPGIDAFDAAVIGAYAHGKGAEATAARLGVRGMLPSDAILDIAKLLSNER